MQAGVFENSAMPYDGSPYQQIRMQSTAEGAEKGNWGNSAWL